MLNVSITNIIVMIFAKIGRRVHDRRHANLDWLTRGADRLVVRHSRWPVDARGDVVLGFF